MCNVEVLSLMLAMHYELDGDGRALQHIFVCIYITECVVTVYSKFVHTYSICNYNSYRGDIMIEGNYGAF